MNADKRRWVFAALVCSIVMLGDLKLQAKDMGFDLENRPVVKLSDELPKASEPILQWAFPTSAKLVGKIGLKKQDMIFGGLTFSR